MIDFLKILIFDLEVIESLNNNDVLVWQRSREYMSFYNSEIINCSTVKNYNGILFCFYENKLEVLIKPHYLFNDNLHNSNDFTVSDCIKVLRQFVVFFNLQTKLSSLKIVNIEFGVNVKSIISCKDLVTYIVFHGKNEFSKCTNWTHYKKSNSTRINGMSNNYKIIKAYSKGVQFPQYCDRDTFRFEVKSKQSKYINKLGISTFQDLYNRNVYEVFKSELLKEFRQVLILGEFTSNSNLNDKENALLQRYSNPFTWCKLLSSTNRNSFSLLKKKYYLLLNKINLNTHSRMFDVIDRKLNFLTSNMPDEIKNVAQSNYNINGNCNRNNVKKCLLTGVDISMQKDKSILLSHTGLKFLFSTNRREFDRIKNRFLSRKWIDSNFDVQISEIAHNIRNRKNTLIRCKNLLIQIDQMSFSFE